MSIEKVKELALKARRVAETELMMAKLYEEMETAAKEEKSSLNIGREVSSYNDCLVAVERLTAEGFRVTYSAWYGYVARW